MLRKIRISAAKPLTMRRDRRLSVGVLLWICLSQFPLPVLHAHDHVAAAADDRLAEHLETKHSHGGDSCEGFHWHLMMPWQLDPCGTPDSDHEEGDEHRDRSVPPPGRTTSPLGWWGAAGEVCSSIYPLEAAADRDLGPIVFARQEPHRGDPDSGGGGGDARRGGQRAFLHTYDAVPLGTLFCVFRC